jgi:hypothetical protein
MGGGHRKSRYAPSLGHLVLFCFVTCPFLLYSVETEETGILRGSLKATVFAVFVRGGGIQTVVGTPAVLLAVIRHFVQNVVK